MFKSLPFPHQPHPWPIPLVAIQFVEIYCTKMAPGIAHLRAGQKFLNDKKSKSFLCLPTYFSWPITQSAEAWELLLPAQPIAMEQFWRNILNCQEE